MGRKDDLRAAFACRQPEGAVPLREVEFHLWDQASGDHSSWAGSMSHSPRGQERALWHSAEIMVAVSAELGFAVSAGAFTARHRRPG